MSSITLPISGVLLQPLGIVPTADGDVLHLLKSGSPLFPRFPLGLGEIYFSEVYSGHAKAWKCHTRQSQNMAVPVGLLRFVLYDDRPDSPSRGEVIQLLLGRPDNYCMLHIPPMVWYGFRAEKGGNALICNCADLPHDRAEGINLPRDSDKIPYKWES